MSATLMPERHGIEPGVFETTAEWECWEHGMLPSGSNARAALSPSQENLPSGSGGYLDHILRGGITFGFVIAAATVTPATGSVARVPADVSQTVVTAPAVMPRRRDEDDPEEAVAPTSVLAVPAAPSLSQSEEHSAATAEMTDITAEDQIATIQDALSLSVTQLAGILDKARGTVYGWMRGEVEVPRDPDTAQRLRDLHRIARAWRAQSSEDLGRLVAAPVGDDQPSLLELLSAKTWDEEAIQHTLAVLADRLETRRRDRRQARERGIGRARAVTPETVELERLRLRSLI